MERCRQQVVLPGGNDAAIVLDDADQAFKIGTRGQRFFAESISYWYGTGDPPSLLT